jgi:hypothetical protein
MTWCAGGFHDVILAVVILVAPLSWNYSFSVGDGGIYVKGAGFISFST